MVLGGRALGGAGVAHQDIDWPELRRHGIDHARDLLELREVVNDGEHLDALALQVRFLLIQLVGLARGNSHLAPISPSASVIFSRRPREPPMMRRSCPKD